MVGNAFTIRLYFLYIREIIYFMAVMINHASF